MTPRRRLIIERAVGASFDIGNDVTVTLYQIRGKAKARILIEAPDSVHIRRTELEKEHDAHDKTVD